MQRRWWMLAHRWVGLTLAVLLSLVALSGSLLAFFPELQRLANAGWPVATAAVRLSPAALAERIEADIPSVRVTRVELLSWEGVVSASVAPRDNTSSLGYDRLILDPSSGAVVDRVQTGALSQGIGRLMEFLYEFHYTLALGSFGMWLLGIAALAWTFDSFVGLVLTLPRRTRKDGSPQPGWWRRWSPAWKVRVGGGAFKLHFDLHRAAGLWLWAVLLVAAWSSVYMNLWDTVYTWSTRTVMQYQPVWTELKPLPESRREPQLGWADAQQIGEQLMRQQASNYGFRIVRPVLLEYDAGRGTYLFQVQSDREIEHRPRRSGTRVYFDGNTGRLAYFGLPSGQYPGNTVSNWLYALHMANVIGLPYRVFVSAFGLVVTLLCVTGLYVWWKKRKGRLASRDDLTAPV